MQPLDRLERVRDLRSVWPTEAADFTPWLASEANIGLLGVELEVVQAEAAVGPYRADIHCRDVLSGDSVLVENQLEKTDHTHLGQLFTYAAGLDAVTVVWIAQRFTEEHRAALDWLNRITHADFRFFGIEVELWRIGDSALAPKFNVVAKPNEWAKTVRETAATESPERAATLLLYADYWQGLADRILDRGSQIRPPRPAESHFVPFPIGKTNCSLGAIMSTRDGWIGVTMLIDLPHGAVSALDMLALDAEEISAASGFPSHGTAMKTDGGREYTCASQQIQPTARAGPICTRGRWTASRRSTAFSARAFALSEAVSTVRAPASGRSAWTASTRGSRPTRKGGAHAQ